MQVDAGAAAATARLDLAGLRTALGDTSLVELIALEGRLLAVTLIGGRSRLHDLAAPADVALEQEYLRAALRRLAARCRRGPRPPGRWPRPPPSSTASSSHPSPCRRGPS